MVPSALLTHRPSNREQATTKRFVISDFDDDSTVSTDQGADSRRSSLSSNLDPEF
jgi:hypothetical protein